MLKRVDFGSNVLASGCELSLFSTFLKKLHLKVDKTEETIQHQWSH